MLPARRAALLVPLFLATTAHAVDWGRLFHGAPPKAPPPKEIAIVTLAPGVTADANVESFLRGLAAAIKAREGGDMRSRLAERYTIDGLPDGAKAADVFEQAIEQVPGPKEFAVQAIERRGAEVTAKVEVRYASGAPKAKTLRFDAAGRLLWSDLFSIQVRSGP